MENYKLSRYTYITKESLVEKGEKYRLVFSTISGCVLKLSDSLINDIEAGNIDFHSEDFATLRENKIIINEENEFEKILTENIEANDNSHVLGLTIQPTSDCQLGCHYCGQIHKKGNMKPDVQISLLERVFKSLDTGKYNSFLVTWYGGEPLLSINNIRTLSAQFIKYCEEKNIHYEGKMVTNGVNLKPNIFKELTYQYKIKDYQITLDGLAEVHNSRRYIKTTEKGSFDLIYNNIKEIVQSEFYRPSEGIIKVRVNVDSTNYQNIYPLLEKFIGDRLHKKIYVYFSPVVDWGNVKGSEKSLTKQEFAQTEIDILMFMHEKGFNIDFELMLPKRNPSPCMVVDTSQEVIDANGNLYPCWEFPYTPKYETDEYRIGNIMTEVEENQHVKTRDWFHNRELEQYLCKDCKFLPACGGGCPKQWYDNQVSCPSFKFNIEERLFLYYLSKNNQI